jgi:APA family basic amino acid/polyamine antiporter
MKDKKIGFLPSVSIVIANMVGVGVFTSLGFQLIDLQDYRSIILIWVVGGFLALLGSFCYAELSATFPKSGGEYHFLRISFGNHMGFLSGWTSAILGFAAPIAAAAHAFAKYFVNVIHTDIPPLFISATLIIAITFIHSISINVGSRFQVYFTIGKVAIMLIFIAAGLMLARNDIPVISSNGPIFKGDLLKDLNSQGFWIGLIFVSYAYSGWNASAYMIEDIKNPVKNVPRSILLGTVGVMILYTLINYVFLKSGPVEQLKGQQDVAHIAAQFLFGDAGAIIISSFISFFLISTISSMIIVGPRVIKRIAQDYQAFDFFAKDTEKNIPLRALLLQSGISLLILVTSSFEFIITSIGFILTIFTTLTAMGVIIMRYKSPNTTRPLKTPLYPLSPIIYCGFNFWIMYYTVVNRPQHVLSGLIFIALGSVFYLWINRKNKSYSTPIVVLAIIFLASSCNESVKEIENNKIEKKNIEVVNTKLPDSNLNRIASLLSGNTESKDDLNLNTTISKLNASWNQTTTEKFNPIRKWCLDESIDSLYQKPYGVFYPFSGPDFPFAYAFYPNADTYILAGLEEAGNDKSLVFSKDPDYKSFIKNAERYFYFSNKLGFFRTIDMAKQFSEKGVIDILAFYLNKSDCKIISMELMKWNNVSGQPEKLQADEKANVCYVEFLNQNNKSAELYYFKKDLSDEGLGKDSLWLNWVDKQMTKKNIVSLTKSASYLMHSSSFSSVRNYILSKSKVHIQDDTGIDFDYILNSKRNYKLFGKYTRTIPLFKHAFNQNLRNQYTSETIKPLPFKIGYNAVYGESNLQVLY